MPRSVIENYCARTKRAEGKLNDVNIAELGELAHQHRIDHEMPVNKGGVCGWKDGIGVDGKPAFCLTITTRRLHDLVSHSSRLQVDSTFNLALEDYVVMVC